MSYIINYNVRSEVFGASAISGSNRSNYGSLRAIHSLTGGKLNKSSESKRQSENSDLAHKTYQKEVANEDELYAAFASFEGRSTNCDAKVNARKTQYSEYKRNVFTKITGLPWSKENERMVDKSSPFFVRLHNELHKGSFRIWIVQIYCELPGGKVVRSKRRYFLDEDKPAIPDGYSLRVRSKEESPTSSDITPSETTDGDK